VGAALSRKINSLHTAVSPLFDLTPALAEGGVGAIALDIEELPPVSHRQASGRGEILLFEEAGVDRFGNSQDKRAEPRYPAPTAPARPATGREKRATTSFIAPAY
jgi:hypothetical protein